MVDVLRLHADDPIVVLDFFVRVLRAHALVFLLDLLLGVQDDLDELEAYVQELGLLEHGSLPREVTLQNRQLLLCACLVGCPQQPLILRGDALGVIGGICEVGDEQVLAKWRVAFFQVLYLVEFVDLFGEQDRIVEDSCGRILTELAKTEGV